MKTLATYSIKGGVGKTTSAVNLAYEAACSGVRVLLWDLDPQGAATFFFRVKPFVDGGAKRLIGAKGSLVANIHATDYPGLDLVPADFSLRHLDLHLDDAKRPTRRLARLLEPLDGSIRPRHSRLPARHHADQRERVLGRRRAPRADDSDPVVEAHPRPALRVPRRLPGAARHPAVRVDRRSAQEAPTRDRRRARRADLRLPADRHSERERPRANGRRTSPIATYAPNSAAANAFRHLWSDVLARLWN